MSSKKIPYDPRQPANEEVFVGRNSIVDQMVDGLRSGHSYGLVGEVGIGKTSVLLALKRKLLYGWFKEARPLPIPVYIELHERYLTHTDAIFEAILSKFIDALTKQHRLVVSEHETLIEEARKGRVEEVVYTLLDQYYKQHHSLCRLIILLDDLHRGLGYEALDEAVSVLRPLVSPNNSAINVSLVLSGESPLKQEFRKDVSSLRGLLSDTIELAPLLLNDVATLVEIAKDYGWLVEPGCEEVVFALTKGYPFRLHFYLFRALHLYGKISQSVLQSISKDRDAQNFLDTMLKQTPVLSKQEQKRPSKTTVSIHPINVFIAYSHKDRRLLQALLTHLTLFQRQGIISTWHDGKIEPGTEWNSRIEKSLNTAQIILLLISADFFASDFCYSREMARAIERHKAGEARVIPIILRQVDWKVAPFAELQVLPKDAKPVTEWKKRDAAWTEVARGIRAAAENLAGY